MTNANKPTIVLCHGVWADGSCFNKIISPLIADGFTVVSVQYGLDTYEQDVNMIISALNRVEGPAILVGHSYGGATISSAGNHEKVIGLIYIAALAPDVGETASGQLGKYATTEVFSHTEVSDGRVWLKPEATKYFAGDLSEEEQKVVWATHYPPSAALFDQQDLKEGQVAWRKKPTWYVLAKGDKTVNPELQRFLADRMNATVTEVDSSHVPMLSHPEVVIDVIRSAAQKV